MTEYFDYESVAREAGLTPEQVTKLVARWSEDYPHDRMLLELRLLRVCMAIQHGYCTFEQALEHEPSVPIRTESSRAA